MLKKELKAQKTALLPHKNLTAALLFSIFFGPLGLLYASLWGGLIMLLLAIVVIGSRLPGPIILLWISCNIWSVFATQRYNGKIIEARIRNNDEEKNYSSSTSS